MTSGEVVVRSAEPGDEGAIADTLARAFDRDDETVLVHSLKNTGAVVASLVAEVGGIVVGHALVSRVAASIDGRRIEVAALSAVCVRPTHRRRGIGTRLVEVAIGRATDAGAEAVVVFGEAGFHSRFGFSRGRARVFSPGRPGDALQALEIVPGALSGESGTVDFPRADD